MISKKGHSYTWNISDGRLSLGFSQWSAKKELILKSLL